MLAFVFGFQLIWKFVNDMILFSPFAKLITEILSKILFYSILDIVRYRKFSGVVPPDTDDLDHIHLDINIPLIQVKRHSGYTNSGQSA